MTHDHDAEIAHFFARESPPDTYEPLEVFTQLAADLNLIRPGDKLDQNMIDFALGVVEKCAAIGDSCSDLRDDRSAGEHIRAILGRP